MSFVTSAYAVSCQAVGEGQTRLGAAGWAGWAEGHRGASEEEEQCRFHIAMTSTVIQVEPYEKSPPRPPCPLCIHKALPSHTVAHCIYSFCLLSSATRFLFILSSFFFSFFSLNQTSLSSAQVAYAVRLHTHTHTHQYNVCFDLDCLSWALHKRACSLLLLCSPLATTVSASLFVLVGDSEHQKLASLVSERGLFHLRRIYEHIFIVCYNIFEDSYVHFN